ncbi:hypothetical protein TNCV_5101 [Trichonephila clavipes]|nr:hypothetical protein TNCV_5101 [Trichonephila clavipes]
MDYTATSSTIIEKIQSVTHHSGSARTIGHHLQWNVCKASNAWKQQATLDWKGTTLCLLTNFASACTLNRMV